MLVNEHVKKFLKRYPTARFSEMALTVRREEEENILFSCMSIVGNQEVAPRFLAYRGCAFALAASGASFVLDLFVVRVRGAFGFTEEFSRAG